MNGQCAVPPLDDLEAAFGTVHPLGGIPRGQAVFIADVIRQRHLDTRLAGVGIDIPNVIGRGTDAVPKEVDVPPLATLIGSLPQCHHDMRALASNAAAYLSLPRGKPAHLCSVSMDAMVDGKFSC